MKVVIYSKSNAHCDMAKRLADKELDSTYKMLDEDFSREELMETFLGARTFPNNS